MAKKRRFYPSHRLGHALSFVCIAGIVIGQFLSQRLAGHALSGKYFGSVSKKYAKVI